MSHDLDCIILLRINRSTNDKICELCSVVQIEDHGLTSVYRCSRGSVPVDHGVEATDCLASGRALKKET